MPRPLVIAYHLVWTAYGWWLPNDPRGSMSREVRLDVLRDLGELHHGRKTVQPASNAIKRFYSDAAQRLRHQLRAFTSRHRQLIAASFAQVIREARYTCYACAVMPDHIHLLMRRHRDSAERMIERFQHASGRQLLDAGEFEAAHPVWGGPGWKVFLDHPDDIRRTIDYIARNPDALRMPRQWWEFVSDYDNWPLHEGHSDRSPYVRRLRAAGRYP